MTTTTRTEATIQSKLKRPLKIPLFGKRIVIKDPKKALWIIYKVYVTVFLTILFITVFEIIIPEYIILTKFFIYSE